MKKLSMVLVCSFVFLISLLIPKSTFAAYDTTAPKVSNIQILTPDVAKPGIIRVELTLEEEETGISTIYLAFAFSENASIANSIFIDKRLTNGSLSAPIFSGKYIIDIPVSTSDKNGSYGVNAIVLTDVAGNRVQYDCNMGNMYSDNSGKFYIQANNGNKCYVSNYVNVKDEFNVAFQTYITNPNVETQLRNMSSGQVAMINFDPNNSIAKKAFFDAIAGQNKTIVFSNDAIQWIINGLDINNATKDIDLKTAISYVPASNFSTSSGNCLLIDFPENGVLPGKMQVRVKSDYIYSLHQLSNTMYLYYLNNNTPELVSDSVDYILDGTNHWCKFEITHNSKYVVSSGSLTGSSGSGTQTGSPSSVGAKFTTAAQTYMITSTTTATLVSYSGKRTTLNIPSTVSYNGSSYYVTAIGDKAFYKNNKLSKVSIPNTVSTINTQAFYKCTKLKDITFGEKLTQIQSKAFYGCSSIAKLTFKGKQAPNIYSKSFSGASKSIKISRKYPSKCTKSALTKQFKKSSLKNYYF